MCRGGKWFLARPALQDSGPALFRPNGRPYLPPLPPATGSTSMSAS
jgi:hypothetical protein